MATPLKSAALLLLTLALNPALVRSRLHAQLDETWTVTVNGQSSPVRADGSFRLSNVSANDSFGVSGPGSAPDGVSDDFFQLEGVSTAGGFTRYVVSEPFQILRNETYRLSQLTVTDTPPLKPASLRIEAPREVLAGGTLQLRTVGVLGDGEEVVLTGRLANTIYRSSNANIATVDANGLLSARQRGSAFITATNAGATAVKRIDVRSDLMITVTGFVLREDGSALAGAEVSVLGATAVTGLDGSFTLTLPVDPGRQFTVEVSALIDGVAFRGTSAVIIAQADRVLDVGTVTVLPAVGNTDFIFANPNLPLGRSRPQGMTTGDVDSDGDLDVVFFDPGDAPYALAVLANEGGFRLAAPARFPLNVDDDSFDAERSLLADLDNDGDLDAALLSTGSQSGVSVVINQGGGEFASAAAFAVGNQATDFAIAHLDGDPFLDIAVTNSVRPGLVTLLLGTGDGGFLAGGALTVLAQDSARQLAAGDLDGDGDDDLLVTGTNLPRAALLFNDGAGGFPGTSSLDLHGWSGRPILADLDDDGDLDAAIALEFHNALDITLNQGAGQLAPPTFVATGRRPTFLRAVDLDADGDLDLASAGDEEDVVTLRNAGGGAFALASRTFSLARPTGFEAFDLSGDGLPELIVSSRDEFNVLINLGGSFGDERRLLAGTAVQTHALADFDVDGDLDIAAFVLSFPTSLVRRLLNVGAGDFVEAALEPPAASTGSPRKVIPSDLDGDGLLDLAGFEGFGPQRLFFHFNAGVAGFTAATFEAIAGGNTADLAPGDVDADGDLDLALGQQSGGNSVVSLFLNDGGGAFAASGSLTLSSFLHALLLADFDGDGQTDLVSTAADFTQPNRGQAVFHRNLGVAGFAAGRVHGVASAPTHLTTADLDGDADLDLAISHEFIPSQLTVLANDGSGSFAMLDEAETPSPRQVVAADGDGDGAPDLVTLSTGSFSIHFQDAARFSDSQTFHASIAGFGSLGVGDLDLDGDLDLTVSHNRGLSLHLNRRGPQQVTVALTGRVLLPDGTPAAGALLRAGNGASTRTDGQGRFSLPLAAFAGQEITLEVELEIDGRTLTGSVTVTIRPDSFAIDLDTIGLREPLEGSLFHVPAFSALGGAQIEHLAGADLDADGDLDLIGTGFSLHVLRNGGGRFAPAGDDFVGSNPGEAAVADLDGDGPVDIVVASRDLGTMAVLRGQGGGVFAAEEEIPLGPSPSPLVLGDLDGDGDVDVVASIRGFPGPLAVLVNQGGGALAEPVRRGPGNTSDACTLGDLDGDGDLDLAAIIDAQPGSLLNPGNGAFSAFNAVPIAEFGLVPRLLLGDLDADGDLDLAFADAVHRVRIAKNSGAGLFAAPSLYALGHGGNHMALADLDGDSDLDLTTANSFKMQFENGEPGEPDLIVHRNAGDGTFVRGEEYAGGFQRTALLAGDLDGDGDQDLALGAERTHAAVFANRGDGNFNANDAFAAGVRPRDVAIADFDGDGRLDLATANEGVCCDIANDTLSVLTGLESGDFAAARRSGRGMLTQAIAVADLDGDGDVDAALTYQGSCCEFTDSAVQVLRNDGAAGFTIDHDYLLPPTALAVAAGDLDADGDLDLACTNASFPAGVSTLLNQGAGVFADAMHLPSEGNTGSLALGDVDGDADLDIAAVFNSKASVIFNPGDATFGPVESYPVSFDPRSLVLGELDGAPGLDLAVTTGRGFIVLGNDGQGTFIRATLQAADDHNLGAMALADLDLDGSLDIACARVDTAGVFLNDGRGGFEAELKYLVSSLAIAAADLDADGDVDLAATNLSTGEVTVLINRLRP